MWQNLQYVSLDVDELQTAMLAVRRLVELDEEGSSSRHDLQRSVDTVVDVRVLGYVSVVCLYFSLFILTLVKSILASKALTQFESAAAATVANDVDVEQRRTLANVLLGNVLELLRFTSAKLSASDELWTIIALTHERLARQSATTTTSRLAHCTRAIDARLKALRAAESVSPEWASIATQFSHVANAAMAVAESYMLHASISDSSPQPSSPAAATTTNSSKATNSSTSSYSSSVNGSSLSAFDAVEAISVPPMSSSRLKLTSLAKRASAVHSEMREFLELSETIDKLTAVEKQSRK